MKFSLRKVNSVYNRHTSFIEVNGIRVNELLDPVHISCEEFENTKKYYVTEITIIDVA